MRFMAEIRIMPKKGVLDPQGEAVKGALHSLNYGNVHDVRIGKFLRIVLEGDNQETIEKTVKEMCEKLLANMIIEEYDFSIKEIAL